ncbi:Uncharacterized mitochondrial protein AtMg01250, partial [Striga hermonthica]
VEWPFLRKALARMGFSKRWISFVEACVEHFTFLVLVNGSPTDFFPSSRGLRQSESLSPSLFVLAADYFSRCLDGFIYDYPRMTYSTRVYGPPISHLSYADDIIIFTRADDDGLIELMHLLEHYSSVTGQLISVQKSTFTLSSSSADRWAQR